jgi:hypothetical protein
MPALQNEKGPAETAISPSHGSSNSREGKHMNTPDDTTGAPGNPETPSIGAVCDMISHARGVIELVNMAAESSAVGREAGGAIMWGCIHAQELLKEAMAALEEKWGAV